MVLAHRVAAEDDVLERIFAPNGTYNRHIAPAGRYRRTHVVLTFSEAWSLTDVVSFVGFKTLLNPFLLK